MHCIRITVLAAMMVALHGVSFAIAAAPRTSTLEVAVPGVRGDVALDQPVIREWRDWLRAQGLPVDRCGYRVERGTLVVDEVDDQRRELLLRAGFHIVRQLDGGPQAQVVATQSQYFDPAEIAAMLAQVHADHPTITRVFRIGTTAEGRDVQAIEISDRPGVAEDEPAIQFNGQHHAREVATSNVVMDIVESLTDGYGIDPQVTAWVNSYKTVCVPMVNPDGVQYVFDVNSLWRRNRMVYPGCTGVDLNRNYPYLWGPGCGSSGSCNDIYRGPSVASEFETQAMIGLEDEFHFLMATSYHSYGQFIDYPYACSDGSPSGQMPEHAVIDEMMHGVSDAIFTVDGTRYTVYSPIPFGGVNGDDTSWYYAHRGTYAFIIEVGTSFEPPFDQVPGIVNQNRGGWRYLYDRLGRARIDVYVTDMCTGEPIEAEVGLIDYVYDTGELPRSTFLPYGRWSFLVVPNDSYAVRATGSGYVAQDATVVVTTTPVSVHIALMPTPSAACECRTLCGDLNADGSVDLQDFASFENCFAQQPWTSMACACADLDGDQVVSLIDLGAFVTALETPPIQTPPNCPNP